MLKQAKLNTDSDTEIVYAESWKGKDEVSIYEGPRRYVVIEHRKSKEDGTVNENQHEVLREDVEFLRGIIRSNCALGEKYGYRYLVRKLIELKKIHETENLSVDQMMEAFNGGKNRAAYYSPLLYYPTKVLEAKGYVQFWGRGGITRLEEGPLR